jgi:hypothetical protein
LFVILTKWEIAGLTRNDNTLWEIAGMLNLIQYRNDDTLFLEAPMCYNYFAKIQNYSFRAERVHFNLSLRHCEPEE